MVQGQSQPHKRLFQCNVLFLGRSDPSNVEGLAALNEPLQQAYPVSTSEAVSGIDSWLSIYTSGILLQLVDGPNPPVFWFPIQNLYIAAANKRVNYINADTREVQDTKFVELGESEAQQSSHAPLFSFISRSSGSGAQKCYTFLVSNDNTAYSLVDNAEYAYKNKSGHTDTMIPTEVRLLLLCVRGLHNQPEFTEQVYLSFNFRDIYFKTAWVFLKLFLYIENHNMIRPGELRERLHVNSLLDCPFYR